MSSVIQALAAKAVRGALASGKPPKVQWAGSPYADLHALEIDQRGNAGERFVALMLEEMGREVDYQPDTTHAEKDWDLMCDGLRHEVKTATLGKEGATFQHENIDRARHYDGLILADFAPEEVYISCWAKCAIEWGKLHRRADGSFYKWDTRLAANPDRCRFPVNGNLVRTLDDFRVRFEAMEKIIRANLRTDEQIRRL